MGELVVTRKTKTNGGSDILLNLWIARLNSVGRTQSRYLFLLLIFGLFFALLEYEFPTKPDYLIEPLKVPVLNIPIRPSTILLFAPLVLAILLRGVLGTMNAWDIARKEVRNILSKIISSKDAVAYDNFPNLIDFVFYKTPKTKNRFLIFIIWISYPLILTLFAVEGFLMSYRLLDFNVFNCIIIFISIFVWITVVLGLYRIWKSKIDNAINDIKKTKEDLKDKQIG